MVSKNNNPIIIILGILLAMILVTQTNFLGALVTTCVNNEPGDIDYYIINMTDQGGSSYVTNTNLLIGNNTASFNTIISDSNIGYYKIIETEGYDCEEDILIILNNQTVNSTISKVGGKKVLISDQLFYWCNKANTLLLSSDPEDYISYFNNFEICTTKEVIEDNQTTQNISTSLAGSSSSAVSQDETTSQTIGGIDKTDKNKIIMILVTLSIFLVGYYFFYEKGGDKGLIKSKRKK